MRRLLILIGPVLLLLSVASRVPALPEIYDASGDRDFIFEGETTLAVDYLGVWNNGVFEDGVDYPYGRIWLILYKPEPYEKRGRMDEDDWNRRDELSRYELPGPSSRARWENGDECVYRDTGIHKWSEHPFDRIVFRILVEEPTPSWDVDTLIWGVIHEDDSYDPLVFENENLRVVFRTLDLPEVFLPPVARINQVWLEHDTKEENWEGLQVHLAFQIDNLRCYKARLALHVHYDQDGEPVLCKINEPAYMTPDGHLTAQKDFIPCYTNTEFPDFALFVPYAGFPESDDYVDYYADIEILDEKWEPVESCVTPVFSVRNPR